MGEASFLTEQRPDGVARDNEASSVTKGPISLPSINCHSRSGGLLLLLPLISIDSTTVVVLLHMSALQHWLCRPGEFRFRG